jgi:hypothetical protein
MQLKKNPPLGTRLTSPNPHIGSTYDHMGEVTGKDLWTSNADYACFLPSISAIYARQVSDPTSRTPAGLPMGLEDLNFLNPKNNLFYYPTALYSSGHAVWNLDQSEIQEAMVQKRNRSQTVIVGDSGGYQIATGVLKWPWQKKPNQSDADWIKDKDAIRMNILRWLEHTCDYSMVLDVPTGSLLKFGNDPKTGENLHPGVKNFRDCLNSSMENHAFFIKHRKEGATRFMNVLQGRNQEEGDIWWDVVKDLPFETWAYSNVQASNFAMNLRRIIIQRDGGYLEGRDWLHYLGNGKIKMGCALTTLQRQWRKLINPAVTLSYDAASPFVNVAKGNIYYSWLVSPENIAFKGGDIPDRKELKNNPQLVQEWINQRNTKWPVRESEICKRIALGDVCCKGYEDLQYKKVSFTKKELESDWYAATPEGQAGDKFKWSEAYKQHVANEIHAHDVFDWGPTNFQSDLEKYQVKWPSSMDGMSYVLLMNHNVQLHLDAIQYACAALKLPLHESKHVLSSDLLEFEHGLCEEILRSETPMTLIRKHENLLCNLSGMDADNSISMDMSEI